jgi:hypothetical protein
MGTPVLTYSAQSSLASACCPNFYFDKTKTNEGEEVHVSRESNKYQRKISNAALVYIEMSKP